MSTVGKICYLVAGLAVVIIAITNYILGVWIPFLYIPLAIGAAAIVAALLKDRKMYLEFLTLRTTKHGMNMGVLILLVVGLLVCVNFFAVKYNKTFDFTAAHLNSLSKQTMKVLSHLDGDVTVKVFYKGPEAQEQRQKIRGALALYQENSSKFKVRYINAYVDNLEAQKYLNQLPDKERTMAFAFVDYNGHRVRIDSGFGEEQITAALIKATRRGNKKIYFVVGHGERDLNGDGPDGISTFKSTLEQSSFKVETLNLTEKTAVPDDAAFVAIVGPQTQFLKPELDILRAYAAKGGHFFLALDPGEKHQLANLVKSFGGEFENNYIITFNPLVGRGAAAAIGAFYDQTNEITKPFVNGQSRTLFDMASEVTLAPSKPAAIKGFELIKTGDNSFTMQELKQVSGVKDHKPHTVAIELKGQIPPALNAKVQNEKPSKDFDAVVVGDSDFLANKTIEVGLNKDFAMNVVASLSGEADLVSIRPREAKSDHLIITNESKIGVVAAGLGLPVILLILSGVTWYRRRGA